MEFLEKTARLTRGAAPPNERQSAVFLGVSCLLHAAMLLLFVTWSKPPIDVAMPGSSGPATPRTQLVRLSPLRTFPSAESAPPEETKARPKPALIKRYTPGAPITVKPERGPARKTSADETKASARDVAPAPHADNPLRWY